MSEIKLKEETILSLKKIKNLFEQIEKEYENVEKSVDDDKIIVSFHTDKGNLKYCSKWGLVAVNELLQEVEFNYQEDIELETTICGYKVHILVQGLYKNDIDGEFELEKEWKEKIKEYGCDGFHSGQFAIIYNDDVYPLNWEIKNGRKNKIDN